MTRGRKYKFKGFINPVVTFVRVTEGNWISSHRTDFEIFEESVNEINEIRGVIISQVIWIEKMIDFIIASYFCDKLDKVYDFSNMILAKTQITTFIKWQILRDIINSNFEENKGESRIRQTLRLYSNENILMNIINGNLEENEDYTGDISKEIKRIDWKKFKTNLHKIIEIRDDFAHGLLHIDMGSGNTVLEYYRNGSKRKEITQEWLDGIRTCIEEISD